MAEGEQLNLIAVDDVTETSILFLTSKNKKLAITYHLLTEKYGESTSEDECLDKMLDLLPLSIKYNGEIKDNIMNLQAFV